jgi:hypothetical protein
MNASKALRSASWFAAAAALATALLAPGAASAASTTGAIWTTVADGTTVDGNIYDAKGDVYLNGGPQNCSGGGGLPEGDYYFQVTDPSGGTLLSTDAIKFRQLRVNSDGVVDGVSGQGNHALGSPTCAGGQGVQMAPFADTPNSGGEYSVDIAPVAAVQQCEGFDADLGFNFKGCANTKNDNFKVGVAATPEPTPTQAEAPTPTPTEAPTPTPTAEVAPTQEANPTATPTATPVSGVEAATGTPDVTPPPTDLMTVDSRANDSWRLALIGLAGLIVAVLLLAPASKRKGGKG